MMAHESNKGIYQYVFKKVQAFLKKVFTANQVILHLWWSGGFCAFPAHSDICKALNAYVGKGEGDPLFICDEAEDKENCGYGPDKKFSTDEFGNPLI